MLLKTAITLDNILHLVVHCYLREDLSILMNLKFKKNYKKKKQNKLSNREILSNFISAAKSNKFNLLLSQ